MGDIFLSASVPVPGRGDFYEDADPFLIQFAVRELLTLVLGRRILVWGGHPAITPMVWSVCSSLDVDYSNAVQLYQSRLFEDAFPQENAHFGNVVYVDSVDHDRNASLLALRKRMLSRDYEAAVFIGGMEGLIEEYELFRERHPAAKTIAVGVAGGAARRLSQTAQERNRIDFGAWFSQSLDISSSEPRNRTDHHAPSNRF